MCKGFQKQFAFLITCIDISSWWAEVLLSLIETSKMKYKISPRIPGSNSKFYDRFLNYIVLLLFMLLF